MNTDKKGASPRHLDVRELHLELRRAQKTIEMAATLMSSDQVSKLQKTLVINKVVEDEDWLGRDARHIALNRTTPRRDYFKVMLIAVYVFIGIGLANVDRHSSSKGECHGPIN